MLHFLLLVYHKLDHLWFDLQLLEKIEAAMSSLAAPSFISGCTSVFAKTPQRDAIG